MNYLQKIYSDAFDEGFDFYSQRMFGAMADAVSREIVREGIRKGESDDEIRDKATKGAWLTSVLGAGGIVGAGAYANHRINKKTDKSVEKVADILKKHSESATNAIAGSLESVHGISPEIAEMLGGKENLAELAKEYRTNGKKKIEASVEELSKKGKEFMRERTKKLRRGIMGGAIGLGALNIMGSSIRGSQNAEDAIQNRKLYKRNG